MNPEIIMEQIKTQVAMVAIIYILVAVAIFADLVSGVRKAKQRGECRTSYGFRRTVDKFVRYYNMLLVITVIDVLQMMAIHALNSQGFTIPIIPILTFAGAIFISAIEVKSIFEKAEDKRRFVEAGKFAGKIIADRDDIKDILEDVITYLNSKPNDNGNNEQKPTE